MTRSLRRPNPWQRFCRQTLLRILTDVAEGTIVVHDAEGTRTVGAAGAGCPLTATVTVWDPAFYPAALWRQTAGVGRAYMAGWWDCPELATLCRILARNETALRRWTRPAMGLLAPWHRLALWARRNTPAGARRNIAAHYDLGDDFFAAFLDPSLTYSCAYFTPTARDLGAAQRAKLDRVCRKLSLSADDHVLEIGTGWGSFAIHAAQNYGCRVTTTTLSTAQARYAAAQVRRLALEDRVTVLRRDYRELTGRYDKLVSLEMIEAVGVRYYPVFFRRCAELLGGDGAMLLQAIVVDDRHFQHDARHVDFIKRYIFPGGVLPSLSVLAQTIAAATDLQIGRLDDLTAHYARTVRLWRERLRAAWRDLLRQGRDEAFLRRWEFYFAYCEGGFRERRIGDVQMLLVKPRCRGLPDLQLPQDETAAEPGGLAARSRRAAVADPLASGTGKGRC